VGQSTAGIPRKPVPLGVKVAISHTPVLEAPDEGLVGSPMTRMHGENDARVAGQMRRPCGA